MEASVLLRMETKIGQSSRTPMPSSPLWIAEGAASRRLGKLQGMVRKPWKSWKKMFLTVY
jgi:hypothetical protein